MDRGRPLLPLVPFTFSSRHLSPSSLLGAAVNFISNFSPSLFSQFSSPSSRLSFTCSRFNTDTFYFRCKWKGKPCNASVFTEMLTRYGQCYTFNGIDNGLRTIEAPGGYFAYMLGCNYRSAYNLFATCVIQELKFPVSFCSILQSFFF